MKRKHRNKKRRAQKWIAKRFVPWPREGVSSHGVHFRQNAPSKTHWADPDALIAKLTKMHERLKYDPPRKGDTQPVWAYGKMMPMSEFLERYHGEA